MHPSTRSEHDHLVNLVDFPTVGLELVNKVRFVCSLNCLLWFVCFALFFVDMPLLLFLPHTPIWQSDQAHT